MPLWNIPYTFSNGTTADASQVDQNFTSLQNLINGGQDDANLKTGGVSKAIATEGVAPSQSIGLPYGIDVFGSSGFVLSGLTVTKDGTNLNQINVAAGVAYVLQSSGSANGQLRRLTPAATNYRTSAANSTYYLDLNPDGSYTWGGHSTQTGYITIATVTSDASSNVNVITDTRIVTASMTTSDKNVRSACSVYQTNAQTVSANVTTKVQFQTVEYDNQSEFDATTNFRFTSKNGGIYVVIAGIGMPNGTYSTAWIYKNGASYRRFYEGIATSGFMNHGAVTVKLNANDYIEVYCSPNATETLAAAFDRTYLQIVQVA